MVIVILVHSQKSYIDSTTTMSISVQQPSDYTTPVSTRTYWGSERNLGRGARTHAIELDVHASPRRKASKSMSDSTTMGTSSAADLVPELKADSDRNSAKAVV